jgi:UDP-hydrolysing UDP-N-acetyl-D-glucosamine 2-epimerase
MKRKVFFLSGTRADYGLMKSTLRAFAARPELEIGVIVTAMHLATDMGRTVDIIVNDGFRIVDRINSCLAADSTAAMAKSIGLALTGITQTFEREPPDFLVLLGDRGESIAGACAAAIMGIAVVHIHCGDVSEGHVDNLTRFAISQYAHVLMPATASSRARLVGTGVAPKRIFVVGAPGLDDIIAGNFTSPAEVRRHYGLQKRPTIVLLYHPASNELSEVEAHTHEVLEAVSRYRDLQIVVLGCNADAGGRLIMERLKTFGERCFFWRNLPREDYLGLLKSASVLVGNSSSGIIEASSLSLPVVNIGRRQTGRECAENVLHVPTEQNAIAAAIDRALHDKTFHKQVRQAINPYGDGKTGKRIAAILADLPLSQELFIKHYEKSPI